MSTTPAGGNQTGWRMLLENLKRDALLALRSLRRTPGFTISAIAILALGIGMSTAMFAVYRAVLIDRLPVTDQDRLVVMHPLDRGGAHLDVPFSYLKTMQQDSSVMRSVTGTYHMGARAQPGVFRGVTISLSVASVAANFFDVLGTRLALGRAFQPSDGEKGAPIKVVLSYEAWRTKFRRDSSVIGSVVVSPWDNSRSTIVGVAPAGLEFPTGTEAWIAKPAGDDDALQIDIVARLRAGAAISAAQSDLYGLITRINPFATENAAFAQTVHYSGVAAQSFSDETVGKSRPVLLALILAVGLLLVIACVNVGNLILVRTSGRIGEIAVRRAIGASYGDIVRQFLVENGLLGIVGGLAGLGCALLLLKLLIAFAPTELPRVEVIRLGGTPFLIAAITTTIAILLFGVAPSLVAASNAPYAVLRSESRGGSESAARRRARRGLVASQMALALVMLAGAGLLARTLNHLQTINLGYAPEHLSLLTFSGTKSIFPNPKQVAAVGTQLEDRLRAVPGVIGAASVESEPFKGNSFFLMKLAPYEQRGAEAAAQPYVPFEVGGPDFFSTMQIPIARGRGFRLSDIATSEQVVVLSEALAKIYFPNGDAVGKRLRVAYDTVDTPITVVGVAHDTHFRTLRDVAPIVYVPIRQMQGGFWNGMIAVRTSTDLAKVLPALRRATEEVAPGLKVWDAKTMDSLLDGPLAQPRVGAFLLGAFSIVALILAAIGLYGVMSSAVRQQTRDIGIRVALGATPRDVSQFVLGDALRVVLIGGAIGIVAALLSTRLLASLLFGVQPLDPLSFGGACLALLAVGALAAYLPARRATRIDPARALRAD